MKIHRVIRLKTLFGKWLRGGSPALASGLPIPPFPCRPSLLLLLLLGLAFFPGYSAGGQQEDDDGLVVTAEQIKAMQAIRINDVLNQLPGLSAGDSSVSIYGSYKVKVLMDGRPINDPTSSHGGIKWDLVPLETVEKIEILRGKGSLKYGDDAGGGVILITTRKIGRLSGNFKAYGGNYDTWNGSVNIGGTRGRLGAALFSSYETTSGYKLNNDKEKKRAGGKLTYDPSGQQSYTLSADLLDEEYGLSGTPAYPTPLSRVEAQTTALALLSQVAKVRGRTFYTAGKRTNTDIGRGLDQELKIQQAGQDVTSSTDLGDWGQLNFGADFQWGQANGTTLEKQDETAFSLYAGDAIAFGKSPLGISGGLRAAWYSAFDTSLNPELKATWKRKKWNAELSYSRANNIPSFHQRYNQTSSTMPNPDLKMEKSDNYSLALFLQLTDNLSATTSLFYNEISDRITYVRNEGTGQYVNFGRVTYQGFDLSCDWKIFAPLTLKTAFTYLEAKDQNSDLWLPAKARRKGNAELLYTPLPGLSLVAGLTYSAAVYSDSANTRKVPGYWVVNLRGEYSLGKMSLFSEIKNLADTEYFYSDGSLAPPLTWLAGVNMTF